MSPRAAAESRVSEATWVQWPIVAGMLVVVATVAVQGGRITERLDTLVQVQTAQGAKLAATGEELRALHSLTTGASARLDRVERLLDERR